MSIVCEPRSATAGTWITRGPTSKSAHRFCSMPSRRCTAGCKNGAESSWAHRPRGASSSASSRARCRCRRQQRRSRTRITQADGRLFGIGIAGHEERARRRDPVGARETVRNQDALADRGDPMRGSARSRVLVWGGKSPARVRSPLGGSCRGSSERRLDLHGRGTRRIPIPDLREPSGLREHADRDSEGPGRYPATRGRPTCSSPRRARPPSLRSPPPTRRLHSLWT